MVSVASGYKQLTSSTPTTIRLYTDKITVNTNFVVLSSYLAANML